MALLVREGKLRPRNALLGKYSGEGPKVSESYLDKTTMTGRWALKEYVLHGKAITILLITSRGVKRTKGLTVGARE